MMIIDDDDDVGYASAAVRTKMSHKIPSLQKRRSASRWLW